MPTATVRSNASRPLDSALAMVVLAGLLLALLQLALLPLDTPTGALSAGLPLAFVVYLVAGVAAWYRRPSNRMGGLMVFAGLALYLAGLANTTQPALVGVGVVTVTLPLAATVHLLHAFPSGRLRGAVSTATVILAYVTALGLQAPSYLFDPDGAYPRLAIGDRPQLVAASAAAQPVVGAVVMLATALLLVRRIITANHLHRSGLIRLYGYGAVAVLALISIPRLGPGLGLSPTVQFLLQLALIAGIPVVFALGVLRGAFAQTQELEELASWLGSAGYGRASLTAALARTLGDPSLKLSFWVAARGVFVDHNGDPVAAEPGGTDRATVEVLLDDTLVGALTYDAALIADPELVRAAGRVMAIAIDRDRLTAELRASQSALQRSRERLVDAADLERRRIAQDLHDGLQGQLVLLGIEAQQLANSSSQDASAARRATDLRRGIDAAAADLRRLAHAVMPSTLTELGLSAAVEDLVDRMPIPTNLELCEGGAWPAAVERTAYFVVAEALANTVKHATATSASVRLAQGDTALDVEVVDDGAGGATVGAGAGLRGLAERVDVLGGTMSVESPTGSGTLLRVRLPCA